MAQHEKVLKVTHVFYDNDDPKGDICYSMPLLKHGDMDLFILFKELLNED